MKEVDSLRGPEALFRPSEELERQGVWLDYGDFRIRITRAGSTNAKLKRVMEQKMRPHRRAQATDTLSEKIATRIMCEAWAEAVILGWDSPLGAGVIPYKGKPYSFSVDNARALMEDLPELFSDIRDQSTTLGLFLEDVEAEDAGN